jgi:hypothetical protein
MALESTTEFFTSERILTVYLFQVAAVMILGVIIVLTIGNLNETIPFITREVATAQGVVVEYRKQSSVAYSFEVENRTFNIEGSCNTPANRDKTAVLYLKDDPQTARLGPPCNEESPQNYLAREVRGLAICSWITLVVFFTLFPLVAARLQRHQ